METVWVGQAVVYRLSHRKPDCRCLIIHDRGHETNGSYDSYDSYQRKHAFRLAIRGNSNK